MSIEKENFLRTKWVACLQQLNPSVTPRWGKMGLQAMVEHMAFDAVRNASGRLKFDKVVVTPEHLEKLRDFMMSDKPFRENTANPLLGEEPRPLKFNTYQAAVAALQEELIYFFRAYETEPALRIINPIFGELDFEQNVQLLYKHALHHLRQFGAMPLVS